jgi:hypothetical protein
MDARWRLAWFVQHADLEAGSGAQMPRMPDPSLFASVRMIRLTKQRKIDPYLWVHPEQER